MPPASILWDKLVEFLNEGRLELDNTRSERSIKPFVIDRKNWLFSNTPRGAMDSAMIYCLIETAKENGVKPFTYLHWLFESMPQGVYWYKDAARATLLHQRV